MECTKIKEMLALYIESELDNSEAEKVEQHLNICEECKAEFKNLLAVMEKIKELPQLEVPEDLHESIMKKIKEEEKAVKKSQKMIKENNSKKNNFKDWIVKHRGFVSAVSTAACFTIVWAVSSSGMFGGVSYDSAANTSNGSMKQSMGGGYYYQNSAEAVEFEKFAVSESVNESLVMSPMYSAPSVLTDTTAAGAPKAEMAETKTMQIEEETDANKKIIKTADISVEVKDFDYTIETLKAAVENCGGYVEDFNSRISFKDTARDIELKSGDITLKVPSEYYDQIVGQTGDLGEIIQNREYVEDVTSQYVDTESLLKAKRLEEERLFAIMEKANTVDELITIEARLGEIRSDIEVYTNRLNNWDRLVKYSTININISQKRETTIEVVSPKLGERISEGFINSINTIKEVLENFVVFAASAVPVIGIGAVLAGIVLLVVKLVRKKKR